MYVIIYSIVLIGFFGFLQFIIRLIREKNSETYIEENKDITITNKHDSEYYWYNKPHYHVMSNGEKINLPDYITWNDWKNLDRVGRIHLCIQLEHRILSTTNKKNNISIEENN